MNDANRTEKTHSHLGKIVIASQVITSGPDPRRVRNIILLLAACVGMMMTGFGIIFPIFARRLDEFGSGVQGLGLMVMSFALAQLVASPFMGALADRFGRRPLILVALGSFAMANIGFLFATSTTALIIVRALEGALAAGLFPATMGVVADIVPEKERARWVGIVMGSYGAGFIFGPVMGGVLYDGWGFAVPFIVSAIIALIAFIAAIILVPETRPGRARQREKLRRRRAAAMSPVQKESLWASLPKPLYIFSLLLFVDFVIIFAFAFIEPQMIFYFYDDLGWTTIQFGVVVGVYGLAIVIGQVWFGRLSDRFGRRPIIVLGLLLNTIFYAGLVFVTWFPLMLLITIIAGMGEALVMPALSAFYLDLTPEQHRARIMGIKGSAGSLGGVAGPLLVVVASALTTPQGVFVISAVLMAATGGLALILLKEPGDRATEESGDLGWQISNRRGLAAQASLRGIVLIAATARRRKDAAASPGLYAN